MRHVVLLGLAFFAASCSDRATDPAAPAPDFARQEVIVAPGCISPDSVRALIDLVFPRGGDRNAAKARYGQILKDASLSTAQHHALQLVEFLLNKYFDGQLVGGQSLLTRTRLAALLNGILCQVGLPPLDPGVLDEDAAAALIEPNSPTTTIVTGTEWAGLTVPTGAVTVPTLITIRRLPNTPNPLLTQFDQYPLFYEYDMSPAGTFTTPVLIGTCLANGVTPPDPSRLRLAHNVAPYTMGSIEILPLEPVGFLDCSDAGELATSRSLWGFDLARGGMLLKSLLLPTPLEASPRRAGAGVGGTVRTFSPFGLVDTLGMVEAASPLSQPGVKLTFAAAPAVRLVTPTGRPMEGLIVDFAKTPIGAILTGTPATSDVNGIAATTSWRLGEVNNTVTATVRAPAGTGFAGVPMTFIAVLSSF